ncbi:MAG: methyltransferase domain-containing protein [Phycisphaerae bacterium]|nr:methyltransferase domain-containing protein [Phycisphaerae bacterium]MCZ2399177.1 methyltransferase domain-containing protein [Phycisphaerae bacterium]NUQ50588.1 methyltransferase domain-containing protein [Phycisphaerae bacterium]
MSRTRKQSASRQAGRPQPRGAPAGDAVGAGPPRESQDGRESPGGRVRSLDKRAAPGAPSDRFKEAARSQFDDWAVWYDRTILNELVFFPSIRACQEELARWKLGRTPAPYRVLDVGCGTGSLLALLSRDPAAESLVGLDFSREMLRGAAGKFALLPASERLFAVNGDAERLPFVDGAFDFLTCCNSFHHYPHQQRALCEFRRVLRPGGRLVLIDGFRDNLLGYVIFEIGVKLAERHIRHARAAELRAMLRNAGFASVTQRKLNVLAPLLVNVAAA